MKKEDLKPYFDALAATFDKKIHEGQGYQIFDQSDNTIDVMEGSPAEYFEELTGEKLSEEIHGNYLFDWGLLSEINNYIEGEPAVQEQSIYSYDVAGSYVLFYVLKLLDDHYLTMNADGSVHHLFSIEFNDEDEVDLSRFIVDYDSFNVGKIRNQCLSMDAAPVEVDTGYIIPEQLEKEYRALLNELYRMPEFRIRIIEFLVEALQGYQKKYLEKFLESDELEALEGELEKSVTEVNPKILANLFFKIIFANYR